MNPLERLVRKLKTQVGTGRPFKAAYEASLLDPVLDLSTYDPAEDAGRLRNAPCLSYLSFKVLPTRKLMMTVFYRYLLCREDLGEPDRVGSAPRLHLS